MIAKRIRRKRDKQTKSDKGLFAYVVDEVGKGKGDPVTWRLAEYALDTEHAGEKVAWSRITNCASDQVGWAVKEILATQARNTRSNTDKSYHLVISFPEGERPTREQMIDIEDEAVKAIGLQDHQRISAVHQNTDNWHLHVAINKVHPLTFRNVEPWYDHYRLQEVCIELEIKHGLHRDNHVELPERGPGGRQADMEAHAGKVSFSRWAQETAAEAIIDAARTGTSWADMHTALAQFDIEVRERGAGLIIVHRRDDRWRVKASDIARELSHKALTDRWGAYVPPAPLQNQMEPGAIPPAPTAPNETAVRPSIEIYDQPPIHRGPAVPGLWARYQSERQLADRRRQGAVAALRAGHVAHGKAVAAYYANRLRATKAARLSKADRMASYQHIAAERMNDFIARVERERQERQQVRSNHPVVSWQQFLEREASVGDIGALTTLRSRARKRLPVLQQIISASDAAEARDIIHANMKPFIGRNGDVFYSIADGGTVVDTARYVSVTSVTTGSIILALELAAKKYNGSELFVRGASDFQQRVQALAAESGLSISVRKSVEPAPVAAHTLLVRTNKDTQLEHNNDRGFSR